MGFKNCRVAPYEPLLRLFIARLFVAGLPVGSMVDAGAHRGGESCFFSDLAPERTVHAMEPLRDNVVFIRNNYHDRPRIHPDVGALGSLPGQTELSAQRSGDDMASGITGGKRRLKETDRRIRVHTIDSLFGAGGAWANETLAFAHFDVEGSELAVLRGSNRTIWQDKPVFTVEVHMHQDHGYTLELLRHIDYLAYDAFIVDECCGSQKDCRNLICVPRTDFVRPPSLTTLDRTLRETILRDASRAVGVDISAARNWLSTAFSAHASSNSSRLHLALSSLDSQPLQSKLLPVLRGDPQRTIQTCCSRPLRRPPIHPKEKISAQSVKAASFLAGSISGATDRLRSHSSATVRRPKVRLAHDPYPRGAQGGTPKRPMQAANTAPTRPLVGKLQSGSVGPKPVFHHGHRG